MSDTPRSCSSACTTPGAARWRPRLLEHHAGGRVRVRSAGTAPSDEIDPNVRRGDGRTRASTSRRRDRGLRRRRRPRSRRRDHDGVRGCVPGGPEGPAIWIGTCRTRRAGRSPRSGRSATTSNAASWTCSASSRPGTQLRRVSVAFAARWGGSSARTAFEACSDATSRPISRVRLGRAAVTVLAPRSSRAADVRDRSRHACVGSDPGGRARGGHRRRRGQRDPRRGRPHPGRRVPHDRARGRVRRGDLGVPQPARGQRDQVLRFRGVQAVGSPRGRDRGGDRAGGGERLPAGRDLPMPSEGSSYLDHVVRVGRGPARRYARGRTARTARPPPSRPPRSDAWAPR